MKKGTYADERWDFHVNYDGFGKSPTSIRQAIRQAHGPEQSRRAVLRCILRHCSVLEVRLIPQDLRALDLELFTLPSNFDRQVPRNPRLVGGVRWAQWIKGHNQKRHFLSGKPRPLSGELHFLRDHQL